MKPVLRPLALFLLHCLAACCRRDPVVPALTGLPVILCAGDSITAASYPKHLKNLLARDGFSVQVINAGAKGDNTAEYIRFLERSQIVERTDPDWVLLQLGTNDLRIDSHATTAAQFRKNLEAILERIGRHRNPDGAFPRIILATILPIPVEIRWHFDAGSRSRVEAEINPAIRDIARRRGLVLADIHPLFVDRPELLPEIHPSEKGYQALAEAWHRILAPLLSSAAKRESKTR
ncbi:MAG: SGNH/GDSL hydrolase family protein [Candidatus Aminicenantes bacterium]|nr:SGNH/GDSL hydrolase family protein [Candidatus Aminicenantes bacterium]